MLDRSTQIDYGNPSQTLMRTFLIKFFLFTVPIIIIGLGLVYFFGQPLLNWLLPSDLYIGYIESRQAVAAISTEYIDSLTRPLIPNSSLGLPLYMQGVISVLLILVMFFITKVFHQSRVLVMVLTSLTIVRHLLWRGLETLDFSSPAGTVIGLLIYAAELLAFFSLALGYFQIYKLTDHKPVDLNQIPDNLWPTVDVFVCTYNEPIAVVYRTLVGCQAIDYPKKRVYLLDDGNRREMAALADKLGTGYISRTSNEHAKAGNLNNAMKYTDGDLILVFDADHVPCNNFLSEVVGFFTNEKMAFVQAPQHFFTPDPFQRNLALENTLNNEQDYFFHVVQAGNDHWGATFFAGSCAIFRRRALSEIGGFATETITEDVHTGLRLHALGWESLYYNKSLSAGLSTDNFADFVKQRNRWAKGMTQVLHFDHPLFVKGLTIPQRICYLTGIWYFFHGLPRMVFLIAPLFFLLFGYKTINAGFLEVLTYYTPSFFCLLMGFSVISRGLRQSVWSEVYETALCFYLLTITTLTLIFPKKANFRVTPKGTLSETLIFNWQIVLPQIVITGLMVFGIFLAIGRAINSPEYMGGIYTNMFWTMYNLGLLFGAIYVAMEQPQYRFAPRVKRQLYAMVRLLDGSVAVGETLNISESGIAIMFDQTIPLTGQLHLQITDWSLNETSTFKVQAVRSHINQNKQHIVGFHIVERSDEQHQKLIRHMFSSPEVWLDHNIETRPSRSLVNLLTSPLRLLNLKNALPQKRRTVRFEYYLPCALEINGQQIQGHTNDVSETGIMVYTEQAVQIEADMTIHIHVLWPNGQISDFVTRIARMEHTVEGHMKLALQFINLSLEKRLSIIRQLYNDCDSLIRVAPTLHKIYYCEIIQPDGTHINGYTEEISEGGLIAGIKSNENVSLQSNDRVVIHIFWNRNTYSTYQGIVKSLHQNQEYNLPQARIAFENVDLHTLYELKKHIHQPLDMSVS